MNFFHFQPKEQVLDSLRPKERYKILGHIGKGRNSDVFSCFDTCLNRIIAVKQLCKECLDDETMVRAFLNEIKLISYFDHPGITSIYDAFVNKDGIPCYTMKLVKGNNLRWDLESSTRAHLFEIFMKLCETLSYVHDKGVVHLDLNPENIMLGQYGEVIITDWGNSRLYDESAYRQHLKLVLDAPPPPSDEPGISSTSKYLSPEQLSGEREQLAPSSDIFSMGIILYEMMTGKTPFNAPDKESLHDQIKNEPIVPIHEICHEIPRMLSDICAKLLEIDPYLRYHSFHEVLIDLDKYQNSGMTFSLRTYSPGEIICREGEKGDFAFTILSGSVEISKIVEGQKKILAIIGKNEIVGELAIFSNEIRTATVTALETTVIRVMDRESVEQELQKLSPWIQKMITGLSKRFVKLNELLVH